MQRLGEAPGVSMPRARLRRSLCVAALGLAGAAGVIAAGPDDAPADGVRQRVLVVGAAAVAGGLQPLSQQAADVQRIGGDDPALARAPTLAQALERAAAGVSVSDPSGNASQLDVSFRGFTASPALGTPQGLSVFVDGVRVNDAFGDTVHWDLLPRGAIASLDVMPGSNPLYGLNTLGGAIAVGTRDGFADDEVAVDLDAGAWGRRDVSLRAGAHDGGIAGFVALSTLDERGWARHDASRVRQAYAKASWRGAGADAANLSLTWADALLGNQQLVPTSWLDDPRAGYTWPDVQRHRVAALTLDATHALADGWCVEGRAFVRRTAARDTDSNVSDDFDPTRPPSIDDNPATGNVAVSIDQQRAGGAMQLVGSTTLAGRANRLAIGLSGEGGFTRFSQSGQPSGTARDTSSDAAWSLDTSLHARADQGAAYLTDTWSPTASTHLTATLRHDVATVRLDDRLGTALNGHHVFRRTSPALGLVHEAWPAISLFGGFDEGLRAPTPVELTCADPNAPCSLPNAFVSDPALKPVVSRTLEAGARGLWRDVRGGELHGSAAVFETLLRDDLQFVSSGANGTSAGYFRNVGRTRRRGVELSAEWRHALGAVALRAAWLEATYRTPFVENSPDNATAAPLTCPACTEIAVRAGDRLPGLPRQQASLRGELTPREGAVIGATLVARGGVLARGDENGADPAGRLPGFARVDLDGRWPLGAGWAATLQVDNLFDRRTSSAGALGRNVFTGPGRSFDASGATWRSEGFRSVGAPRGIWLGLSWSR